jgi:outer membrane biosynthesis protein TonB
VTSRIHTLAVLLVMGLSAAGCVTSRAQIPEQAPTLAVPPVPPRAIEPPVIVEPPVEPPPVEPAPPPVAVSKPPRRPAADKPDPKQEPPPDSGATVPTPPPVAPLRSAATPIGPEAEKQIREILENTQKALDKVDPGSLASDDRKANFEQAKAFLRQADEALKKEELTQARLFAERAQNIAKQLQSGR